MLDNAFKYVDEIADLELDTWYKDKYKYYCPNTFNQTFGLPEDDMYERQFVSLRPSDQEIIGLISYNIDRDSDSIVNFGIINFTDSDILIFGRDVAHAIDDIFCKYNFRKMEFYVVCGNPIEKTYDKLIKKYGGRVVGTSKLALKLIDNQYYDKKMYELFRKDYIKHRKNACN